MEFHNTGIQPWLIITVHRQMSLIIPIRQLVDNAVKKLVLHPFIRTFFRIFIRRAELTSAVAAVDRFQVHHQRLGCLLRLHKIVYIILL